MRFRFAVAVVRLHAAAAAAALLGLSGLGGCATAPVQSLPAVPPAVLWLDNLAPYDWRITAAATDGTAHEVEVTVSASVRLELPAGDYTITQEAPALAAASPDAGVRRFTFTVTAGETYRWRLVTLAAAIRGLEP
jgi:hypothetical protein